MSKPYASRVPFSTTSSSQYYAVAIPVSQGGGLANTRSGGAITDKTDMTTPRRRNNSLPGQTSAPSFPAFRDEMAIQKPAPIVSSGNSSAAQVQLQSTIPVPTSMASQTPLPQLSSTLKGKSKAKDTSTHSLVAGPLSESSHTVTDSNVISLLPAKTEHAEPSLSAIPRAIGPPVGRKKQRRKWSIEETKMLVAGCNKHGVGNWKAILDDPTLTFAEDRTPVDLKDRFRTYFPQSYRQLYPNAKTHLSSGRARAELPDTYDLFEKNRSKKRRPFTPEEDAALREGFEKHGTVWALIAKNPVLASRRSTDLRDRFRNAFPDLYEQAGYKPRPSRMQKKKSRSYEPPSHLQDQSLERVQEALDDPEEEEADMACDDPYGQATYVQESKAIPEQSRPASAPGVGRPSMSPNNGPSPPAACLIQAATAIPNNASTDGGDAAQVQTQGATHAPLPYQPEARVHPSSASPPSAQLSPTRSHSAAEYFSHGETRGGYDPSMFDLKAHASWYPHRWLSATSAGGATTRVDELAEYQSQSTSGGANSHIWQTWLPSGGWANQQAVIDRYDLPAPSFVHEFASEAAVGDTGSSISGAADVTLPPSSHHRYAGDLFHGRGTYGGYGGPLSFVYNEGQMSFGRAVLAMDLGGTNAGSADVGGRGVRPQDLTLNTMDEYPNMSMEELSASASEPLTVQASSPPPFPQQLQRQQIQPLSSASSSQHRLDALTEGLSLSSPPPQSPDPVSPPPPHMNATRSFSSTDRYPVSSSGRHQYGYGGSTNSHSRSLSQPPSEHRLPMDVRSATALNSPAQSPYELTNGNAGFSPLPFSGQNVYGTSSPVPQVPQSPIHLFSDQHQQQNSQLGRQFLSEFYNPQPGLFSLSTAAAALDLHGFNGPVQSAHTMHANNYGYDRQFLSYQGTPTMGTTSLSLGLGFGPPPGATGNNQASSFGGMDQYVDFGTNALDLATGSNNNNTMNSNYSSNGLGGSMLGLVEEPTSMTVDANTGRSYALQMSPSQAPRQRPPPPPPTQQQQQQADQGVFSGRVMSTGSVGVGIPPSFTQFGPTSTPNHQHDASGELFAGAASNINGNNSGGGAAARSDMGRKRASWGGQR